uniref:Uncharacterized protein n=1 Tax=Cacopsylla melanoneura TaxID=428564 RepID=A0A8D8SVK7_9HEMI
MRMDRNTQSFNHHLVKDLIKQEGISPKKYNIYEIIIIPYICGSVLMNAELNYLLFCIEQKITTSLKVRNHENLNLNFEFWDGSFLINDVLNNHHNIEYTYSILWWFRFYL